MKKWIRWQGLGAFVIVVIIVFGFWYLFIDGIVKRVIEKQATQAVGAKVELEEDLKKGIFAKVDGPLGQAKESLGGFDGISGELAQRGNLGNSLMKNLRLPF